ncbi:hypothetical protein [Symmachiella dynata]|uniref:hypothetical protein n=1 Tax=Symmachiella dynata TaxID=2527995 RepID=UPI0030ECA7E1
MRNQFSPHSMQSPIRRSRRRSGFVLVMVLVLIALAGISLAGLARRSLQLAQHAAEEQERLQRRWGTISCQQMFLDRAEELLEKQAATVKPEELTWPLPGTLSGTVELGGLQFEFYISDEDAKANLNMIYRRSPEQVRRVVGILAGGAGSGDVMTNVRLPNAKLLSREMSPLGSWGQVFEPVGVTEPGRIPQSIRKATRRMTCWGSGKLNIRRADATTVRTVCTSTVSQEAVGQLLALRAEPGQTGLSALTSRMTINNKDRSALRRLIIDESRCHAAWITCRSHQRTWKTLIVDRPGDGSGAETLQFTW